MRPLVRKPADEERAGENPERRVLAHLPPARGTPRRMPAPRRAAASASSRRQGRQAEIGRPVGHEEHHRQRRQREAAERREQRRRASPNAPRSPPRAAETASCPVAELAPSMPITSPRRSENQRVETIAPITIAVMPVPRPTITPQNRTRCQSCVMNSAATGPPRSVRWRRE